MALSYAAGRGRIPGELLDRLQAKSADIAGVAYSLELHAGVARAHASVLKDLGCTVRTVHRHSVRIHKGKVIRTKPRPGTYPARTLVKLVVSSGL